MPLFKTYGRTKDAALNQVNDALKVIEHYHIEHTDDIVTRFKASGMGCDVYVVQDPEWKARLEQCIESIFPPRVS